LQGYVETDEAAHVNIAAVTDKPSKRKKPLERVAFDLLHLAPRSVHTTNHFCGASWADAAGGVALLMG
jgi:hypothetical protein